MNRITILIGAMLLSALSPVAAQSENDIGADVILGSPTGVGVLVNNRVALAAAWNIENYLHLHADVWLVKQPVVDLIRWYFGIGGKTLLIDNASAVVRFPSGLQWYTLSSLELFLEVVPGMQVIPDTDFDFDAGIRFHF